MLAVLLENCIIPACANASYCAFGSLRSAKLQRLGWRPVPEQHYHALERKESISYFETNSSRKWMGRGVEIFIPPWYLSCELGNGGY